MEHHGRAALVGAILAFPLGAQDSTGFVRGSVVDSAGAVVQGAIVRIDNATESPGTDSLGRFIISDLTPGSHRMRVLSFFTATHDTTFVVVRGETTSVALVVKRTTPREVWLGCAAPDVVAATNVRCVSGRVINVPLGLFPRDRRVVRDRATWVGLWKDESPPAIDWFREMVIISSVDMYDANGGDPVRVNRVTYEPDRVVVFIGADTVVRRGRCCLDAIISPVAVVIPRSDLPVVFLEHR